MTAIQLAGSFVNANLHFHTLVPEGVWHEQPDGSVAFHPLPPPTDEDVEVLAVRIVRARASLDASVRRALFDGLLRTARAFSAHPGDLDRRALMLAHSLGVDGWATVITDVSEWHVAGVLMAA